jgi:predicted anti-sigma-YlaC factor YlaD
VRLIGVDCEATREAISAQLDGESAGVGQSLLEAHLGGCAACRAWREHAHEVTRRVRLASARPAPSPGSSTLAAVMVPESRGRWWRSLGFARAGLVAVAVGQLIATVPALLFGSDRGAPIHVAHEMGAFDMALAVGFLVAACRPTRAQGMRALVGCAALLLVVTAAIDLLAGRTTPTDELPHLLAVAGWLLLWRTSELVSPGAHEPAFSLLAPVRSATQILRPANREGESEDIARHPDVRRQRLEPGVEPAREAGRLSAPMAGAR